MHNFCILKATYGASIHEKLETSYKKKIYRYGQLKIKRFNDESVACGRYGILKNYSYALLVSDNV